MADISDREITAVPDSDAEEPTLHPVLDVPVVEHEISRSRGIDWVVFGVTSIAALAWVSGLVTLAGIAMTLLGLFQPHLLHLH